MTTDVSFRLENGVARIGLGRPAQGSPLDPSSVRQLADAVTAARHQDARIVVLGSDGPNFSVGGDLTAFAAAQRPGDFIEDLAEALHRIISDLHRMDAVVISAVRGVAAGAGFPLAAAADLVIATETAKFTMAYTKVGLTPDGGSTLLTATLGLHRTLALALLNPILTAAQAQEAGLVTTVVADDELDTAVQAMVTRLLAGSRTAQVGAKRLIRERALPYPEGALRLEALSIHAAADSPDGLEGVQAFVAKRPAVFKS
jgi:2-(1,2-epoxy-1,2-dihydrophenyl)acetyl-CoA isomerase